MIKALNLTAIQDFTLPEDTENPTVWQLKPLDTFVRARLDDLVAEFKLSSKNPDDKADMVYNSKQRHIEYVRFGLVGFRNFADGENGKNEEVKFETVSSAKLGKPINVVSDRILQRIPMDVVEKLSERIREISSLTEEQIKN